MSDVGIDLTFQYQPTEAEDEHADLIREFIEKGGYVWINGERYEVGPGVASVTSWDEYGADVEPLPTRRDQIAEALAPLGSDAPQFLEAVMNVIEGWEDE